MFKCLQMLLLGGRRRHTTVASAAGCRTSDTRHRRSRARESVIVPAAKLRGRGTCAWPLLRCGSALRIAHRTHLKRPRGSQHRSEFAWTRSHSAAAVGLGKPHGPAIQLLPIEWEQRVWVTVRLNQAAIGTGQSAEGWHWLGQSSVELGVRPWRSSAMLK